MLSATKRSKACHITGEIRRADGRVRKARTVPAHSILQDLPHLGPRHTERRTAIFMRQFAGAIAPARDLDDFHQDGHAGVAGEEQHHGGIARHDLGAMAEEPDREQPLRPAETMDPCAAAGDSPDPETACPAADNARRASPDRRPASFGRASEGARGCPAPPVSIAESRCGSSGPPDPRSGAGSPARNVSSAASAK